MSLSFATINGQSYMCVLRSKPCYAHFLLTPSICLLLCSFLGILGFYLFFYWYLFGILAKQSTAKCWEAAKREGTLDVNNYLCFSHAPIKVKGLFSVEIQILKKA